MLIMSTINQWVYLSNIPIFYPCACTEGRDNKGRDGKKGTDISELLPETADVQSGEGQQARGGDEQAFESLQEWAGQGLQCTTAPWGGGSGRELDSNIKARSSTLTVPRSTCKSHQWQRAEATRVRGWRVWGGERGGEQRENVAGSSGSYGRMRGHVWETAVWKLKLGAQEKAANHSREYELRQRGSQFWTSVKKQRLKNPKAPRFLHSLSIIKHTMVNQTAGDVAEAKRQTTVIFPGDVLF